MPRHSERKTRELSINPLANPIGSFQFSIHQGATVAGKTRFGLIDHTEEIATGEFPGLRGLPTRALNRRLDGYIDPIIEHDMEEAGAAPPSQPGLTFGRSRSPRKEPSAQAGG